MYAIRSYYAKPLGTAFMVPSSLASSSSLLGSLESASMSSGFRRLPSREAVRMENFSNSLAKAARAFAGPTGSVNPTAIAVVPLNESAKPS